MRKTFVAAALLIAAFFALISPTMAQEKNDRWFKVKNNTDQTIVTVDVKHVEAPTYGEDRLGEETVVEPTGTSAAIKPEGKSLQGYCMFLVRALMSETERFKYRLANLCRHPTVVFDENDT